MKEYERPIVSIINFSAEEILDDSSEVTGSTPGSDEGVEDDW